MEIIVYCALRITGSVLAIVSSLDAGNEIIIFRFQLAHEHFLICECS